MPETAVNEDCKAMCNKNHVWSYATDTVIEAIAKSPSPQRLSQ